MDVKDLSTDQIASILAGFDIMIEKKHIFYIGLCAWAAIALTEYHMNLYIEVDSYIERHEPDGTAVNDGYWWPTGDIEPRLEWIHNHYHILSEEFKSRIEIV